MRKIVFIFITLYMVSCNQKEIERSNEIVLTESKLSADELMGTIEKRYIPLETTDECLFTEITQLFCTQKELFIFDIYTQSVYVFNHNGKFLRKLHKTGVGPGEYAMISAITVNEKTGRIVVVNAGNNIISYDLNSFEYLEDKKIEAVSVVEDGDRGIIAYNSLPSIVENQKYDYHILRYDKNGKLEKTFLPIRFESGYTMRPIYRFYREDDKIFIYLPFSSNVYQIKKDSCISVYNVKYGDFTFPSLEYLEQCQKTEGNYVQKLYMDPYIHSVQIFSSKDFLISQFYVGMKKYIGFYNKKTGNGEYSFLKEMKEDVSRIDYFQLVGSYQDSFISYLKLEDISGTKINMDENLRKIISTKSEESNPVLLFLHIKKAAS